MLGLYHLSYSFNRLGKRGDTDLFPTRGGVRAAALPVIVIGAPVRVGVIVAAVLVAVMVGVLVGSVGPVVARAVVVALGVSPRAVIRVSATVFTRHSFLN